MKRVHGFVVPEAPTGNEYPSPTSSLCSNEAKSTFRKKKSPDSSQAARSKKSKNKIEPKSTGIVTKPAYHGNSPPSSHEQYMELKSHLDRTYCNLDSRDIEGFEQYKFVSARLQHIAEDICRGGAIKGGY